jgi:OmpA-OmpF porin, OOP family
MNVEERRMKPITAVLFAVAALGATPVAVAQKTPLKATEVTESAITEALASGETQVKGGSRGFAPALRPQAQAPVKKPSAAVLITFVTDSSELTAESRGALDVIARAMRGDKLAKLNFVVEGHADPRGEHDHNMELSRSRAESVVGYLVAEHGIERTRLVPVGKGAAEPLNKAQLDAPENRRVTFVTVTN